MTKDIICIRCLEPKYPSEFPVGSQRCKPCKAEAMALNVAQFRANKKEREANLRFNQLMKCWRIGEIK